MVNARKAYELMKENPSEIPDQFQVSEKMLEKFPPKEPLLDPPRKGKTARANGERPTMDEILPPGKTAIAFIEGDANWHGAYRIELIIDADGREYRSDNYVFGRDKIRGDEGYAERWITYCPRGDADVPAPLVVDDDTLYISVRTRSFKRAIVGSVLDSLEKEAYKIDFLRTDIVYDNRKREFKYGEQLRASWNGASNVFQLFKNNREVDSTKDILHNLESHSAVFSTIFPEDKADLYLAAYEHLGRVGHELKPNLGRALKRFKAFKAVEILYNAGVPEGVWRSLLRRMASKLETVVYEDAYPHRAHSSIDMSRRALQYTGDNDDFSYGDWRYNPLGTKPVDILLLPKWAFKDDVRDFILERISSLDITILAIQRAVYYGEKTEVYRDIITNVLDTVEEGRRFWRDPRTTLTDLISEGVRNGDVKNHARLLEYLTFDLKFSQGIENPTEGYRILSDYYNMCHQMDIKPISFPQSLKLTHDVTTFNYNKIRQELDSKKFAERMTEIAEIKNIDYAKKYKPKSRDEQEKEWRILVPASPKALVQEGNNLNHCVGSYVENVTEGNTSIVFLREFRADIADEFGKSILTIEVKKDFVDDEKHYYVNQALGQSNRQPTPAENEFLDNWCKKTGIFRRRADLKQLQAV